MSKLALISFDSVSDMDFEALMLLPNFSSFTRASSVARGVSSVFISNTYPAHASIVSGRHPCRHGIIENTYTKVGDNPNWRWHARSLTGPTLWREVLSAGGSVASILWPTTAGSEITYNMPEIFNPKHKYAQIFTSLSNGSFNYQLNMLARHFHRFKSFSQPSLDHFLTACACDTLRIHKPDLLMLHLSELDTTKHLLGPDSPALSEVYARFDTHLGYLIEAARGEYTFILLGDHSCLPVKRSVDPNFLLPDKLRGKVYFHNAGGCSFLHVHKPVVPGAALNARHIISEAIRFEEAGIARFLDEREMDLGGFSKYYSFGIEAQRGVCFGHFVKGQHGYSPLQPDYTTFYIANGSPFGNSSYTGGSILDITPLAASVLDIPFWEMDGTARL